MTEEKQRFSNLIDKELDAAKSGTGAFANLYKQQQSQWIQAKTQEAIGQGQAVNSEVQTRFAGEFDAQWDKNKDKDTSNSLKATLMKAYAGPSKDEQLDGVADKVSEKANTVLGGMATSLVTGGNPMDAANMYTKHGLVGLIMGIPFVGEFLGQVMSFLGNKIKRLFGSNEESLSWSQAGEKVERENIKTRIAAEVGQYADSKRLAKLVDESARKLTPEEVAAEAAAKKAKEEADKRQAEEKARKDAESVRQNNPTTPGTVPVEAKVGDAKAPPPPSTETADPVQPAEANKGPSK